MIRMRQYFTMKLRRRKPLRLPRMHSFPSFSRGVLRRLRQLSSESHVLFSVNRRKQTIFAPLVFDGEDSLSHLGKKLKPDLLWRGGVYV